MTNSDDLQTTKETIAGVQSKGSESDLDGRTLSGISTPSPEKAEREGSEQGIDLDERQIITLPLNDPEHPNNWSKWKKRFVLSSGIATVIHSTLGSSLPSNAVPFIAQSFGVTSQLQMVLPVSTFLMVGQDLAVLKKPTYLCITFANCT